MRRSFGDHHIDLAVREVRGPGGLRQLEPKAAAVLERLLDADGAVVTRQALLDTVWPNDSGSDEALSQAVAQLRRAFGDDPRRPRYIRTLHKAGYQWIAARDIVDAVPVRIEAHLVPRIHRPMPMRLALSLLAIGLTGAGVLGFATLKERQTTARDHAFVASGGRIDRSTRQIADGGRVMEIEQVTRRRPPTP